MELSQIIGILVIAAFFIFVLVVMSLDIGVRGMLSVLAGTALVVFFLILATGTIVL